MPTVEQKGSHVEGGLLTDEFLDSAANVLQSHRNRSATKGAQQFFTPPEVADFIASVLVDEPGKEIDPTFDPVGAGTGNLLQPFAHRYGIEIDRDYTNCSYHKMIGDCQIVADLATAIGMKCRRIVANPPFGLRWKWRGKEGRSAQIAWRIIDELLAYNGRGAIIVPTKDFLAIKEDGKASIVAHVEVPGLFGRDVDVPCVIAFFSDSYYRESEAHVSNPEQLPDLIPHLRTLMRQASWQTRTPDNEFREQFDLLRNEFQERQKNQGNRRSCIQVQGKRIKVYLSPFERVRLIHGNKRHVQDQIKALNGQSIYQFADSPKDWRYVLEVAKGGDLEIGPEVHAAYERVRQEAEMIRAPMLPNQNEVLRVAALRDVDRIQCRKDDEDRGFKAGETYDIDSRTTEIHERSSRQVVRHKRDPRTGNLVPELHTQELLTERKAIRFEINGEDFVVGNEKDADLIRYLVEHFELPEVRTIAELQPEEFERCKNRIRKVVKRYAEAA